MHPRQFYALILCQIITFTNVICHDSRVLKQQQKIKLECWNKNKITGNNLKFVKMTNNMVQFE